MPWPGARFDSDDAAEAAGEDDLWFLPGPDLEEDVPPGMRPARPPEQVVLFEAAPWRAAQAELALELAEVAGLFGALDQRLRTGPAGWGARLALREVADLSWWSGARLSQERIALWDALRIGATEDTERALARAGWAIRRLTAGPAPGEGLARFLERTPRARAASPEQVPDDPLADLSDILASGPGLHPVAAAARLFHAWRALGPPGAADLEAAVLGMRHAAGAARAPGQGALFLPLAQTGTEALRGQGDPRARLAAWLRGAERATLAALLHLDRVATWRQRVDEAIADLSGRTPHALVALLEAWPLVSASLAEAETGASRAAVQRNLDRLEQRGVIREITGQGRYRFWVAAV